MRFHFSHVLLAGLLTGTASFAADPVPFEPQTPVVDGYQLRSSHSWQGGYIGVNAGYHWTNGVATWNNNIDRVPAGGANVGAFFGYNHEFAPSFVAGVDADIGYDGSRATTALGTIITGEMETSVRGRVGFVYDKALLYAAGGYTGSAIKMKLGTASANNWLNGWTVGSGVDYAVTDRIFVRGEYRYSKFFTKDIAFAGVMNRVVLARHTAKAGIGAKF